MNCWLKWQTLWNGTGGEAPEGPHLYFKDDWYYLVIAEGGTGLGHMVTAARSRNLTGPYESNPANPMLTAANVSFEQSWFISVSSSFWAPPCLDMFWVLFRQDRPAWSQQYQPRPSRHFLRKLSHDHWLKRLQTTNYFQTVGHADLFADANGEWWGVALSTRSGPAYENYPMGRETVLTAVTWEEGEFPVWTAVSGEESGWAFPSVDKDIPGLGPFISEGDDIDFAPGSTIPAHFTYWRFPNESSYAISPEGHSNTLRLFPSTSNLTALNGMSVGPGGQTFVGRRQQDTLFTYRATIDYSPTTLDEEAGVTAFLTPERHFDLGVVLLPANESTGTIAGTNFTEPADSSTLIPQIRYRGVPSDVVPETIIAPIPDAWAGKPLTFEIQSANSTHFSLSAGPAGAQSQMQTIVYAPNSALSYAFTGKCVALLGHSGCVGSISASLTSLRCRYLCGSLCHEQWREWHNAGVLLEMAVHTTGTIHQLMGVLDGGYKMGSVWLLFRSPFRQTSFECKQQVSRKVYHRQNNSNVMCPQVLPARRFPRLITGSPAVDGTSSLLRRTCMSSMLASSA